MHDSIMKKTLNHSLGAINAHEIPLGCGAFAEELPGMEEEDNNHDIRPHCFPIDFPGSRGHLPHQRRV